MNDPCAEFRERLAAALSGRPAPDASPQLRALAWHAHLAGCAECAALLEGEQALEAVLASLPDPQLDAELARRVLLRLERARTEEQRLEALLALDRVEPPPAGLAAGVLAALAAERADPLDALLDSVPAPAAPAGLGRRVLAGLAPHRRRGLRRLASWPPALRLAAAALLLASGAVLVWRAATARDAEPAPLLAAAEPPPPELLEALDLLESWELITSEDLDVLLASLDPLEDELLLLDLDGEGRAEDLPPPIPPPQERKG